MKNNIALIGVVAVVLAGICAYFLLSKKPATVTAKPSGTSLAGMIAGIGAVRGADSSNDYVDNWDFLTDGSGESTATYYDETIGDSDGSNDTNS